MKYTVTPARNLIHDHARTRRHVRVHVQAPKITEDTPRSHANLAFVLDRSGSMGGGKFELARQAAVAGIERLTEDDTFSVIVFDSTIDVVQPALPATPAHKRAAIRELGQIQPRGTTDLGGGWLTGCGQVAEHLLQHQVGRCLLLTDGHANRGITDPDELAQHATALRARGVSTSTFGLGAGFDEFLLRQMADAGGGTFTFIDHEFQIHQLLNEELGETLQVVARDVILEVTVPARVTMQALVPYPVERTASGYHIRLPDLVSRQDLEFPLELNFPSGERGQTAACSFTLRDREEVFEAASHAITWTHATAAQNEAEPSDRVVDRLVAERHGSAAREEATRLNRDRRYGDARHLLQRASDSIALYADDDAAMLNEVNSLLRDTAKICRAMPSKERKQMHARATSILRGGERGGKGRKIV